MKNILETDLLENTPRDYEEAQKIIDITVSKISEFFKVNKGLLPRDSFSTFTKTGSMEYIIVEKGRDYYQNFFIMDLFQGLNFVLNYKLLTTEDKRFFEMLSLVENLKKEIDRETALFRLIAINQYKELEKD